jgi:hypothetical protein
MSYPVRYEADYHQEQNRWITIFRPLLAIPWYIVGSLYAFAGFFIAFLAYFAIIFSGRYPASFYSFNAGVLRFIGRAYAFAFLQTDRWPPIGMEQDPAYPIRVEVDPPLPAFNRWKTAFRLVLGIPVMFMVSLFQYLYLTVAVIAWFHIVFMGRTSGGIHNALTTGLAYQLRTSAYFLLVTETFPPVSDQEPAGNELAMEPAAAKALPGPATAGGSQAAEKPAASKRKAPAKKAALKKPDTRS